MPSEDTQERSSSPSEPGDTNPFPRDLFGDAVSSPEETAFYLVVLDGHERGRWIELGDKPLSGGRDSNLGLVLEDAEVSRLHVLISVIDGAVVVEDLGSTNGTFVDGGRVATRAPLAVGSILRVGDRSFRCERRARRDIDQAEKQDRDLDRAANYVLSLLPAPVTDGPIRTEWMLLPAARLGGDAFGYQQLDSDTCVLYLIDVCGHGVGAAMHSVSVLNVLRQRALPGTSFKDPVQVLTTLNAMFQMDRHDDQYFTMWYGVYDTAHRTLTYACAGHHPGYLVSPDRRSAIGLKTSGMMIGAASGSRFEAATAPIPADSSLYLFSDGVFEILTDVRQWRLDDFLPLLLEPRIPGVDECQRLYQAVNAAGSGPLEDDFSVLVVTFP